MTKQCKLQFSLTRGYEVLLIVKLLVKVPATSGLVTLEDIMNTKEIGHQL